MRDHDREVWVAVVEQLESDSTESDRSIATRLGVGYTLVGKVRRAWVEDPENLRAELTDPMEEFYAFWDSAPDFSKETPESRRIGKLMREQRTSE